MWDIVDPQFFGVAEALSAPKYRAQSARASTSETSGVVPASVSGMAEWVAIERGVE